MEEIKNLDLEEDELKDQNILLFHIASLTFGNFEFSALRSKTQNTEYLGKLWLTDKELFFKGYKILELGPIREPAEDIVCKLGDPFKTSIDLSNIDNIFIGHDETYGRRHQIYPKLRITSKSDQLYFILFNEGLVSVKEEIFETSKQWQSKIEEITKKLPKEPITVVTEIPKPKVIKPIKKVPKAVPIASSKTTPKPTPAEALENEAAEITETAETEIPEIAPEPTVAPKPKKIPKPVVAIPKKKTTVEIKPVPEPRSTKKAKVKPLVEETVTAETTIPETEPTAETTTEEINEELLPNIAKLKQASAAKKTVPEGVTEAIPAPKPKAVKEAPKKKEKEKGVPKVAVKPKPKEKTATEMLREEEERLKPKFKLTTVKPYESEISTKYTPLKATIKPIAVKNTDDESAIDKVIGDIREEMDIEILSTEIDSMTADTSINKCPGCGWLLAWDQHKCPKCKKEV